MKFNFRALTQSPERLNVISTKLGSAKTEVYTDADLKKPMVMGTQGNMVIAAEDAEIEEISWLNHHDLAKCSQVTKIIMAWLKSEGKIE